LVLVAVMISLMPSKPAEAGFYTGQSFAAPMENGTKYGHYINDNYSAVTGVIWGSTLMKAGFFLVIFLTLIKIGFRTPGGLKDAGAYLLAIILLAGPIFNGKSLLLMAADASDSLTVSIVQQLGGLNYQFAGSAVASMMAQTTITNDVLHKWRNELWYFRRDCYNPYNAQQPAGTSRQDPFAIDYGDMSVDPLTVFWNVDFTMSNVNCNDYKQNLGSSLQSDFSERLQQYQADLAANGVTLSPQDQQLFNNLANVSPDELVNKGVYTYSNKPEDDKQPGLVDSIVKAVATSRGWENLLMLFPRLAIAASGFFFVYIFNYYIFQLVTVIKIIAAIGMALGVLYYMFFRKIELPITALGIWVFANGWYILAATAMNQYWNTLSNVSMGSKIAQVLLGAQGAVTDGLFAVGLIGVMGSLLAGILSWKGLSLSMHHAPGVPRGVHVPRGSGSSRSTGGTGGASTK
jgi:hypothetical protein